MKSEPKRNMYTMDKLPNRCGRDVEAFRPNVEKELLAFAQKRSGIVLRRYITHRSDVEYGPYKRAWVAMPHKTCVRIAYYNGGWRWA